MPAALLAVVAVFATMSAAATEQILLGPIGAGTSKGAASWLHGANGAGDTTVDIDDPAAGACDFTMSNSVPGAENNADWRCPPFSLGAAAGGARPITFSFAYKLADAVGRGNNIHVQLRFFDKTGTNFIAEHVIPVGARTGDSRMTNYRTRTFEGIFAPPTARTADVWINANIFEPWASGTARFADFSVTTARRSLLFKSGVLASAVIGIGAATGLFIRYRRLRAPAHR